LEEIEEELKKASPSDLFLADATNRFYTLIPHYFGEELPPTISNSENLKKKYEHLEILGDIEVAASMMKVQPELKDDPFYGKSAPLKIFLLSSTRCLLYEFYPKAKYQLLKNDITPLDRDSEEWQLITKYEFVESAV
jgi:hypothetical protein